MTKSPETEHPLKAFGCAARDTSGVFSPFKFSRRHEIVGEVTEVGSKVKKAKVGDKAGVGCLVGACRECGQCANDLENYCPKLIPTYNFPDVDGSLTYGGYSNLMVATEHFIIRWPENLPLDIVAPLLCAGITAYSPLRYFELDKPRLNVCVVAVKFAKAFGRKVMIISTSLSKKEEAISKLGTDEFFNHFNYKNVAAGTLDGVNDTVSATHPIVPLLSLLKPHGKLVLVGAPEKPLELPAFPLIQDALVDFEAKHNMLPDIELIPIDYINTAKERLLKADVKYRFVIDITNSLKPE
ncbi:Alcohol dehydrogenase, class V [Handroanthus impetiginosus]|uniref:Alcohol dehydrogenase, class V n=1 Tax=Handroanthus impetiginosus TaxID=429701 RepID=A0A2G9FZB4_9LAMI|nr:Alcohol dehydrogenase, class V [Handroanthus impetiginosus]